MRIFGKRKHRSPPSTPAGAGSSGSTGPPAHRRRSTRSGRTTRSRTRTTRRSTTCRSARQVQILVPNGERPTFRIARDLRPAVRRLAVQRAARDLDLDLRQALHDAAGPVRLLQRRTAASPEANNAEARQALKGFPNAKVQDRERVQEEPGELPREHPQHPLRAARAVGDRQPVRDREHARADDLRAHARARDAARGRHDPLAGAVDGHARERRHGADRRRRSGSRSGSSSRC